jgi:YVTN family beta-propeller protein
MKPCLMLSCLLLVCAIAAAQDAPATKLYVCNNEGTNFMVVDTQTHEVVKTIEVGGKPHGLTVTAKGDRAYISVAGPDEVVAIDTATDAILWRTKVGPNPHMLSVTPDGRFVYVCIFGPVHEDAPSVPEIIADVKRVTDVIDVSQQKRIKTIETGLGPHVSFAPSNARVYITAWFDQRVSIIDTATHEVVRAIPFDGMVRPIAIDRAEQWMYVALSGLHGFVLADLDAGKPVKTIENPPYPEGAEIPEYNSPTHGLSIRPGEKELYVTSNVDDKIYIYSIPDCTLVGKIDTGDQPNWIAFNPDGSRAYVSNAGENTVSAINTDTREVIATIPVGDAPKRLAVIGDFTAQATSGP